MVVDFFLLVEFIIFFVIFFDLFSFLGRFLLLFFIIFVLFSFEIISNKNFNFFLYLI